MTYVNIPTVRAAMLSDQGRTRPDNQDACLLAPERGLFIVSDGISNKPGGAIASHLVIKTLPVFLDHAFENNRTHMNEPIEQTIKRAVCALSTDLHSKGKQYPGLAGMGAAVVLLLLHDHTAHIAHMGDSRTYLLRQATLQQLTEDHTIATVLMRFHEISAEEAVDHPGRYQLSRYIGMTDEVFPDVNILQLVTGDRLLLCSDGLTSMLNHQQIAHLLQQYNSPESACQSLVAAANAAGGHDNVSVIVIDIDLV